MGWGTGTIDTTHMDASTDNPNLAREEIKDMADQVNAMIAGRGAVDGVCELDGSQLVPATRLGHACKTANNLSDVASPAAARTNLGATSLGALLFAVASAASARSLIAALGTAGGAISAAITWAGTPSAGNDLTNKTYVDAAAASKQAAILTAEYAHQESSGVNGGTSTAGAWQTRILNTEVQDTIGGTLSANQMVMPAGTYLVRFAGTFYDTKTSQVRLANVTDATYTYGLVSHISSAHSVLSEGCAVLTLGTTKTFELHSRTSATQGTTGCGRSAGWGGTEVYATVSWIKIA